MSRRLSISSALNTPAPQRAHGDWALYTMPANYVLLVPFQVIQKSYPLAYQVNAPAGDLGLEINAETGAIEAVASDSPIGDEVKTLDVIVSVDDRLAPNLPGGVVQYVNQHAGRVRKLVVKQREPPGSKATNGVMKQIIAPPGRLGIRWGQPDEDVPAAGVEAPAFICEQVMDDSPLHGKLAVNDVLVSIDNIPAASMKEDAFTEYMVANAGRERAFVVSSPIAVVLYPTAPPPASL